MSCCVPRMRLAKGASWGKGVQARSSEGLSHCKGYGEPLALGDPEKTGGSWG